MATLKAKSFDAGPQRRAPRKARRLSDAGGGRSAPSGRFAAAGLLLVLATLLAYLPALRGGFVWDDVALSENPLMRSWGGIWDIWFRPWLNAREEHYWPLVYSSFWLEYRLWGLSPLGYHLTNVLLHGANSLLLWRILRRLEVPGAWLAAWIFALHPVHVESAAWVIERKDVLSAAFYFAATLAYLRFDESQSRRAYILAFACFVAGMLSKSIVVTWPLAMALCLWRKHGRAGRKEIAGLAPMLLAGGVVALADMLYGRSLGAAYDPGLGAAERLLAAARSLCFSGEKLVWPAGLVAIYPHWEIRAGQPHAYLFLAMPAALLGALFALRNRIGKGPFAAMAFYVVTLAPILGIIGFGFMKYSFVADRFQYLASAGPIALFAAAVHTLSAKGGRYAAAAAGCLVLAPLWGLTWHYSAGYGNAELLWQRTLDKNPKAWEAHHHYGLVLSQQGKYDEGVSHFREALRLRPDYPEAMCNLGLGLQEMGQFEAAERAFRQAAKLGSGYADPHNGLGVLYARQGRYEEAIAEFREALRLNPDYSEAQENLELAQEQRGRNKGL